MNRHVFILTAKVTENPVLWLKRPLVSGHALMDKHIKGEDNPCVLSKKYKDTSGFLYKTMTTTVYSFKQCKS